MTNLHDHPTDAGMASVTELAHQFTWATTYHGPSQVPGKTRLTIRHRDHELITWWWTDSGVFDQANLYRDGAPDLGCVATTHRRDVVVGWVAAHGTAAA